MVGSGFESLMTADYSQIEMRIMAHASEDAGLIEAFTSGADFHTVMASRVFGVAPDEVGGGMRAKIKAMNYGLAYGLSDEFHQRFAPGRFPGPCPWPESGQRVRCEVFLLCR